MEDNKNKVGFEEAIRKGAAKEFALLYMMSEMILEQTKKLDFSRIDFDECLEARFFDRSGEIFLYRNEGEWDVRILDDPDTGGFIDREYPLSNRFKKSGLTGSLVVREYLSYDEDGQVFIQKTRLLEIRERSGADGKLQ